METEGDSDSSDDFGPRPLLKSESAENIKSVKPRPKKRKVEFEKVFLSKLPTAERYEKSYMHRDVVTQIVVSLSADFIVTGSIDGHLKFWKKMPEEVEFVKHFHAHLGALHCLALGSCGRRLASTGADRAVKCYDVVAFDMTDFMECQEFTPTAAAWVHHPGEVKGRLAVAEAEGPKIRIYYGEGLVDTNPLAVISVHSSPVVVLAFSLEKQAAVSTDRKGMIEYWDCEKNSNYAFPEAKVQFRYKMDTDLFELAKARTRASCISFSTDGSRMAVISLDKQVRVFDWEKGKLQRIYDERIQVFDAASAAGTLKLDSIDYGRRTAVEREMEESDAMNYQNCTFDDSGNFLIYSTLLGIKVVNVTTNQLSRVLGRHENNERFLHVSLYQGIPKVDSQFLLKREKKSKMAEELNKVAEMDPTIFCTAFKKRRFYMFTNREPVELAGDAENGRDVFNEKPTAEEQVAVFTSSARQLGQEAIIRTTMGDIHIKLYHQECPRTVENFSEHSRNGYYDGLIFHRVIKGFMIQTGDPLGDGTGGESIWGGEFEDEFHRNLRHDRPFTVSMANAGPNTNGSQFFITTVPCPWLDNKHTVFGRVTKGMEACQAIEGMKVDRFDKPYEEIKIINVDIT